MQAKGPYCRNTLFSASDIYGNNHNRTPHCRNAVIDTPLIYGNNHM